MKYLLDTNAVIALMKGNEVFCSRLRQHLPADFGLPSIVAHELYYGAYNSQAPEKNLARVEALQFETISLDREDARRAGEVRAILRKAGKPVGAYDLLIAGQALARDLVVITHNVTEFRQVPDLRIEDWE
ncbi:MAG: type II toxin-antitoxin system VapC family toxin [Burkholderiaceae bacterium]